ncbi:DEAD/DEAH box helicase, partial [Luteococcus sp.]|uniref:DEAD/DEAH box helicase n=1 Tax=Luteococcus sp. TaxID=1969402 RepID=UPI0037356E4F
MPRPTPHGRKAAKTPGFKPGKNRWSDDKRAAMGKNPRKKWEPREERPARDDRGYRGNDDRVERGYRSGEDRPERSYRSDAPRTSDSRGRNFERVERPAQGGFGGRAPRSVDRGQFGNDRGERRDSRSFNRDERGPRRDFDDRGPRKPFDDRGPRRDFDVRGPRKSFDDRGPRKPFEDRAPRRDFDDRGPRREFEDRAPRREFEDRAPRREYKASRPVHDAPRPKWEPRVDRKPWEKGERPSTRARFDDRPRRDDVPADERTWRDERRDDRGARRPAWGRDENRGREERSHGRDDRRRDFPREDRPMAENLDQMSWEATDLGEIDDSGVDVAEGFAALGVPKMLVAALDKQGITAPFPIQAATIPDAITGRDVLGRGQTGSGKTLGFGLPMLTRLSQADPAGGAPRALVLVPTRELALQCADVLAPLAKTLRLDLTLIAGGMGYGPQLRAFERGVDIVVATPGRLIDLLEQGAVDLSQVMVTVLDEADHMADLGFMPAVTTLMDSVPADGQRLLFSATLDHAVDRIVKKYLHDPVTHEVDSGQASVTTMEHVLLQVLPHDKNGVTAAVANREGRSVLFCRTQMGTNRVAEQLRQAGVMAGALHGGLTQGARTRILAAFKDGTVPVLVATDVAARGIHVDDVTLVLEIDPPMSSKDYLHRAGRTARAGQKGVVASIVLPHQRKSMARLTGQAGVKVQPVQVRPGDDLLSELTGARTPDSAPIEEAEYERLIAPRRQAKGPRQGGGGRGGYRGT